MFGQHGLDAGVDEIAREAGVGLGTLYRRFPTKDALIDELVHDLATRMRNLGLQCLEKTDGTGLEAFFAGSAEVQSSSPGYLQRLWNDRMQPGLLDELRAMLADLLRSAQAHQRVRPDITATDVSVVLWSIRGVIETTRDVAPHAWRRQLEIVMLGLRPSPAPLVNPPLSPAQSERISARR